ncbi:Rrf2 family transcriptional regulator [Vibrio harveyi]|uniref:Rrf2 family transcriptional regulator n=1 Tax=Vibrio harveyi TaxID=669 RepID=UPI003BB54736
MTKTLQKRTLLSSKLNVALSIAGVLAAHTDVVTVECLSKRLKVSASYIEQVIALLRKGKVVSSTRGPGGGYTIASRKITVRDVIRSVNANAFKCQQNQVLHSALEAMMGDLKISELHKSGK